MLIDIGGKNLLMSYLILEGARASTGLCVDVISSSVLSFTQFFPICGRMPLPALSLWPGRQPYRSCLVDGRLGCGPSYVAPRSRNPPTRRRRDCPISSSLFSHDPPPCAHSVKNSPTEPVLSRSSRQRLGHFEWM